MGSSDAVWLPLSSRQRTVYLCFMAWNPTNTDDLARAGWHYCYEVERAVLQGTDPILQRGPVTGRWGPVFDALLEAFLIHVRLLHEFYYVSAPKNPIAKDDVRASHFVPTWEPARLLTKEEWGDVNAQLSHFAGRRQIHCDWQPQALLGTLKTLHLRFVAELPASSPLATTYSQRLQSVTGVLNQRVR